MKIPLSQAIKQYVLQFAELYHRYKVASEKLHASKYYICSSLEDYKKTGLLQLAYNDKPGDRLPAMTIVEIKRTEDILAGLHPVDVNSINDLYYLSQDKISRLVINDSFIEVIDQNGSLSKFNIDTNYSHENTVSKRVSFLIGYMQAERFIKDAYAVSKEKYKIIRDHISTLHILNLETKEEFLRTPMDILFSSDYQYYSKEDIRRVGYICGQMSNIQSNESIA